MGTAGTGIIERWTPHLERLWPVTVLVRVVVAVVLIVGPATDEPAELAGWDAERFQEIAERQGPAWVEHPVEYPPGSVILFDALAGDDVVDTHRRLVALSLVLDLVLAVGIGRRVGSRSATAYLLLGLPLVPFGYQRLDTLVTAVAVVGALVLLTGRGERRSATGDGLFATAVAVGAMLKVWPVLLVVGAVAVGRWRAAAGAMALTALAASIWLLVTGDGLDPVDQVLSLRGATGWHVESLPGSLVALTGTDRAELELDAYRIGTLRPTLVTAGRALAVVIMGLLALAARHRMRRATSNELAVFSLTVLGAVAALLVTAPLLSPQFLVWLVPWAALAPSGDGPAVGRAVALSAGAAVMTGVALHGFGPAGLTGIVPAALLTGRNLALAALPVVCLAALTTRGPARTEGSR